MDNYKIILVDDHQILKDGILLMLENNKELEVIAQGKNGQEAVSLAKSLQPNLVILDLDMPIMNGLMASKQIKQECPEVRIMILSLHAEKSVIEELIKWGVDSYLLKNTDKDEFLKAIDEIRKGNKYFSSEVTIALTSRQEKKTQIFTSSLELEKKRSLLSEREYEILQLIAQGFTNKEIGEKLFLSFRTIDSHRATIMNKLDIHKVTGLVRFALKTGMID